MRIVSSQERDAYVVGISSLGCTWVGIRLYRLTKPSDAARKPILILSGRKD